MRRNLDNAKHLLDLIQAYANESGIFLEDLINKWIDSSGNPDLPLKEAECIYLTGLLESAGYLTISGAREIQMTWAGHDYLDSKTIGPR